jgi:hypothetical protein
MNRKTALAALASLGAIAFGVYACSEDGSSEVEPSTAGPGQGGATSTSSGEGGDPSTITVGQGGGQGGEGGSCADLVVEATYDLKPADIIFIIDNSGSMSDEIAGVENNINVNFANIIQSSGVDYQVIMLTNHGVGSTGISYLVCIDPPLSGTTNCSGAPVNVPGQFYHYSVDIQSWDSVCKIFNTLYGPNSGGEADAYNFAPGGWATWLRPEAVKVFVEITDDQMNCTWGTHTLNGSTAANGQTAALEFDSTLLGLAPAQFGTTADRRYIFYSIVGIGAKPMPNELDGYTEFEPIVTTTCPTAYNAAYGYQWLSKGTGGLRFPVCSPSYDAVFQDIAAGVIDAVQVPCEFDIPDPPKGEMLDLDTIDVLYTPGGNGTTQTWTKVDSASLCGPSKFYIDEAAGKIILCPQACAVVEADIEAKLEVKIECGDGPD